MSAHSIPSCHLAHVPGPARNGQAASTAVWICEYPYRTMRLQGPSSDCAECPVWQAMEQARLHSAEMEVHQEVAELEEMLVH